MAFNPLTQRTEADSSPPLTPPSSPEHSPVRRFPINKIVILVTSDSELFRTAEITGFTDAPSIKGPVFAKLQIWNERNQYAFFQTVDGQATSGALSDEELCRLCVEEGDRRGSLRFLVARP
ncbi:unnamed protein product [Peniophora sp. CBMAI 1063]|nr:unnamed protein product [Peniophora sp. CBMAI 1063]